jgi:hypothetical protein
MKRITLFFAFMLTIALAFASASTLTIRSSDNSAISVIFNGQQLLQTGNVIRMENVRPGKNTIEVFRINSHRGYNNRMKVYQGYIQVQPRTEIFATVNPFQNQLRVDDVVSIRPRNGNGWGNNGWSNYNQFDDFNSPTCNTPTYVPGPMAMDPISFNQLKQTMANSSFESTKLNIFKQALSMNYFTSTQIAEVMSLFAFESYKVDVAKSGYTKTLDPQNFYIVNNQFSFSSSVNELSRFVASR